jgi:hypothetical protein
MNFRRWITALAVLTLFAGLAAAQTSGAGGGTAMTCTTVAQVTPTIRSEGITELVGDVLITCAGGSYVPTGTAIPMGNIVVSLTAPVTSRLTTASSSSYAGAEGVPSEAILMVDEPNSGLAPVVPGFGPGAPLSVCGSPNGTACVEYAQQVGGIPVASSSQTSAVATFNVFQGNVQGSTVSFQGVPFLPPVSPGVVRVYRITNIRVNATNAGASLVGGFGVVQAQISTNGQSTLAISQPVVTVAYVATSLTTSVSAASTKYQQCNASSGSVGSLNFIAQFPSAFKTRVAPIGTTAGAGTYSSYLGTNSAAYYMQNTPGQLYASESGFILPVNGVQAGLADFGTRFQAVFANLPTGATIYVSQTNTGATANGYPGYYNAPQQPFATYTAGGPAGTFTAPTNTTTVASTTVVPLSVSSGAATAVWEVVDSNTSVNQTFSFGVYINYNANAPSLTPTAATPPATGAPQVTLTYAPITSTSSIPRFIAGPGTAPAGLINVIACQTLLLFPYVTSTAGFDTGLAISNTSMDPIGTTTSSGACTLNFYGTNAPTTAPSTGTIAPGTMWANNTFSYVPYTGAGTGFSGYVFATCFFQNAHGFAFVSDYGARNLAMGYLALIVNNGVNLTNRNGPPTGEALNN